MDAGHLKAKHRTCRELQPEHHRVRIHRSISWLARAEKETGDPDAGYIFLWIAFNAAYASEFGFGTSERQSVKQFIDTLLDLDTGHRLHDALFHQFSGPIRTLIDNRFVYAPFWKALREHDSSDAWSVAFASSKRLALRTVLDHDTPTLLSIVLDRLYVLRNQLVHGGATWGSSINRAQVKDGVAILAALMPIILDLMIEHDGEGFPETAYPVV